MDYSAKYEKVTLADIDNVATMLHALASGYRSLLTLLVTHHLRKTPWSEHILELDGMGLSAKKLFADPHTVSCSLPESFKTGEFKATSAIPLAGAWFMVCPKDKTAPTLSEIVAKIPMNKADIEQLDQKEEEQNAVMMKMHPQRDKLPKNHVLLEKICIDEDSAEEWLGLLGTLIEYYLAAVEPLVSSPAVSPTLEGCNAMLFLACAKAKREQNVRGAAQKKTHSKEALIDSILGCYQARYDDFQVYLSAVRREGTRRTKPEDEIFVSKGSRRTRMNETGRKAMIRAIWELSNESDAKISARDVYYRMKRINPGIANEFNYTWISGGKGDITREYPDLEFISKTKYRITAKSITQLGQSQKFSRRKHSKKSL